MVFSAKSVLADANGSKRSHACRTRRRHVREGGRRLSERFGRTPDFRRPTSPTAQNCASSTTLPTPHREQSEPTFDHHDGRGCIDPAAWKTHALARDERLPRAPRRVRGAPCKRACETTASRPRCMHGPPRIHSRAFTRMESGPAATGSPVQPGAEGERGRTRWHRGARRVPRTGGGNEYGAEPSLRSEIGRAH